jgi:hypothetical protein
MMRWLAHNCEEKLLAPYNVGNMMLKTYMTAPPLRLVKLPLFHLEGCYIEIIFSDKPKTNWK